MASVIPFTKDKQASEQGGKDVCGQDTTLPEETLLQNTSNSCS